MSQDRWFAVMAKCRKEHIAELNLRFQGYKTFYPHKIEWTTPTRTKPREVKRPYLTRYLFVAMNGDPRHSVYNVNSTIGVSQVVRYGPYAFEIPAEIMQELISRADEKGKVYPDEKPPEPEFEGKVGDKIRFSEVSPLFGFIAEIARIDTNGRLMVTLNKLLGASRDIDITRADVGEIIPSTPNNGPTTAEKPTPRKSVALCREE